MHYMLQKKDVSKIFGYTGGASANSILGSGVPFVRVGDKTYFHPITVHVVAKYLGRRISKDKIFQEIKPDHPYQKRAWSAVAMIAAEFPVSKEAELFRDIVTRAVLDLEITAWTAKKEERELIKQSARNYLSGDIVHAQMFGINSEWIQRVLRGHYLL